MMRLLMLCCVLPLVAACDGGSSDPAPVPYTAVPQTPSPLPRLTAPVLQP
ncbi:hypothetical protein [Actinocorallia populi]|nr:hypothetical protein [Actinocorallia populi]